MKSKSATELSKLIVGIFNNLKLVSFIVIMVIGLIFAIITLAEILNISTEESSTNTSSQQSQITLSDLNKLNVSSDNSTVKPLPSGRINPFSE